MTICCAAITKEGVVTVSDCRVTYQQRIVDPFSDSLLKTIPVTNYALLSFAGDILCAQFLVTQLNAGHITRAAEKGGHYLLTKVTRQLGRAYREYSGKYRRNCHVAFLFAASTPERNWIGTCESPTFKLVASDAPGTVYSIGDTSATRTAVSSSVSHAIETRFEGFNLAMLMASSIESTLSLLYPEHYLEPGANHGVSSLFTIFRLDGNAGISVVPYITQMFKGRIADRNSDLGYGPTNEVVYRPENNSFVLMDHQTGKSNVLTNIYSFRSQHDGIINTKFDPYELQG